MYWRCIQYLIALLILSTKYMRLILSWDTVLEPANINYYDCCAQCYETWQLSKFDILTSKAISGMVLHSNDILWSCDTIPIFEFNWNRVSSRGTVSFPKWTCRQLVKSSAGKKVFPSASQCMTLECKHRSVTCLSWARNGVAPRGSSPLIISLNGKCH